MKSPLLTISFAAVVVVFLVSCQPAVVVDQAASSSVAKAKGVSRSLASSGSLWTTNSIPSRAIYKYHYSAAPETPVSITQIPLQTFSVTLDLKEDHTFTSVVTITSDANSGLPYVPENWKYSTNSASLFPAAWPSDGDRTSFSRSPSSDLPCGYIAGNFYSLADDVPSEAYSIGGTATYHSMPVHSVTYTILSEVAPVQNLSYTGTWATSDSTSTLSAGQSLVLTFQAVSDSNSGVEPTVFPQGMVTSVPIQTVSDSNGQTQDEFTLTLPNGFEATFFSGL